MNNEDWGNKIKNNNSNKQQQQQLTTITTITTTNNNNDNSDSNNNRNHDNGNGDKRNKDTTTRGNIYTTSGTWPRHDVIARAKQPMKFANAFKGRHLGAWRSGSPSIIQTLGCSGF